MIVLVTPAERDLARLDLELADRLGEPRDLRMEAIANAPYVESEQVPSSGPLEVVADDAGADQAQAVVMFISHGRTGEAQRLLRSGSFAHLSEQRHGGWDLDVRVPLRAAARMTAKERQELMEAIDRELAILSGQVEPTPENSE